MDCALWLNRRKIFTAAEISGNLDVASLRGYLLAGTLISWLNEHGGKRYADKLSKLSPDDDMLNEKIAAIFGANSAPFKELKGETAPLLPENTAHFPDISISSLLSSYPIGSVGSYNYEALSSFGSLQKLLAESSYSLSSSLSGSLSGSGGSYSIEWEQWLKLLFGYGSFTTGSYEFGSFGFSQWEWLFKLFYGYGSFTAGSFSTESFTFSRWEWEWLFRLLYGYGSFSAGSALSGSFWQWEWLFKLLYGYGSFSMSSFIFGSFSIESLLSLFKSYGSFTFGSFGGSFGSFGAFDEITKPGFIDEYDFIMLRTLANCPLDRFGYGIHNI